VEITANQSEALKFFGSLAPSVIRLGLESVQHALGRLQRPDRSYPIVHVAGTNGKGSTCVFIANCLLAQGFRVGLYTSPHLVRANERFQVNGRAIDDALLVVRINEILERYPEAANTPAPLTYFEFGTLIALWHFQREKVDVAVLETGLGGRLDATNAVEPRLSAITSLSIDHVDYLGTTLEAIAGEKAGIIKAGTPCVIAKQPLNALRVVEARAAEIDAPLQVEGRDFALRRENSSSGYEFVGRRSKFGGIQLGLRGQYQLTNAAVAICALENLARSGIAVSERNIREGLATVRWPGRLEELATNPPVLLDGAHNLAAVESLVTALKELYPRRRIHLVFGVLADKAWEAMIRELFPRCASVHLTPLPSPRSLDPQQYFQAAKMLCDRVAAYPSPSEALRAAMAEAKGSDFVLCAGSFFLVGAVRAGLLGG
jgi:dihydrofolate synthase/folylpolyglutamate synthase